MDLEKVFYYKDLLEKELTFEEICKCFREICYAQVAYYNENNKGIVYNDTYTEAQIEQASRLQQRISTCVDLYNQIISKHNEFDEDYLRDKGV